MIRFSYTLPQCLKQCFNTYCSGKTMGLFPLFHKNWKFYNFLKHIWIYVIFFVLFDIHLIYYGFAVVFLTLHK